MTEREDNQRKALALVALAANFDKKMPESLLELWLDLLAPYSAGAVRAAVRTVMESYAYKTLPPFAVLKEALDDLSGVSERSLERQAMAEWGLLLRAIAGHGYCHKPVLHPTTEYVVRLLGGWQTVCLWTQSDLSFKRRDFVNFWIESHGRVDCLEQGAALAAASARPALASSSFVRDGGRLSCGGPLPLGEAAAAMLSGVGGTPEGR